MCLYHNINSLFCTSQKAGVNRKYDTYLVWIINDPPKGLGNVSFFIIKPSPLLNEITLQTWVDELFVQILALNFTVTAKKKSSLRRHARENRAVL